jgi:hypothetical protein
VTIGAFPSALMATGVDDLSAARLTVPAGAEPPRPLVDRPTTTAGA